MKPAPETITVNVHSDDITRAAQWLADRRIIPDQNNSPIIPTLKARFDLTTLQAAQACTLANRYRLVRKAFA